jgi:alginate O-acetyltransferase complex protein AlgI
MLMDFCKPAFAAFFLVIIVVYWRIRQHSTRMGWLLLASAAYYATFNPWFLLLLFASTIIDYLVALRLTTTKDERIRRLLVALSVAANLGVLAWFKYVLLIMHTGQAVAGWMGWAVQVPGWKLVLPLGISFYTFEAISYVVDVYRRKITPFTSLREYMLYILFFPHLLAGPIVRPGHFAPQLRRPKRLSWPRAEAAAALFLVGLFKKAVLGDWMASLVDPVFKAPGDYSTQALWLATLGYAVQIFGDFSGYSDMAIALALALGFRLAENFRAPYLATSMSDFWRRWHISLSSWLRDYVFIPLGGSRAGEWQTCRNLMLTMALGGLWHGASWTFVLWGVYHGGLLVLGRLVPVPRALAGRWMAPVWILLTFLAVCVGWVLFRAQSFADAGTVLAGLVWPVAGKAFAPGGAAIVLAGLAAVIGVGLLAEYAEPRKLAARLPAPVASAGLAAGVLLYLALLPLQASGFIYFNF